MRERVLEATKMAKKEPFVVQEFYVNGFKLMIHWDDKRGWYECCMHYSPRSSSYYKYDRTEDGLVEQINNEMKSWGGVGNYNIKK